MVAGEFLSCLRRFTSFSAVVGSSLPRDLDALNQAIALIYDAILQAELWPLALDALATQCEGAGIGVFPLRQDIASMPEFLHSGSDIGDACTSLVTEWYSRCPFMAYDARQPVIDRCIWDGDLVTPERIRHEPFYQDYARSFELGHAVMRGTSTLPSRERYALISPFWLKAGPPSDSQRATFELLSAHAAKALAIYLRLGAANRTQELMNLQQCGVVTVNASGTVIAANDVALNMSGDGFSIADKRLRARRPSQQRELDRMLASAFDPDVRNNETSPVALARAGGRKPLIVTAFPGHRRKDRLSSALLKAADTITVIITDPEVSGAGNGGEATFAALGLTKAEAKVAAILGSGASPEAAAETLAVSVGTVRTHLKSVYSKLGISRQSELVAMAGKMAALGDF